MITVDFFGVGPEYQSELSAVAAEVYKVEKMKGNATVELSFASSDEIRELNRSSRGVDRETDVLSFPALDEIKPFTKKNYPFEYDPARRSVELGSIVICREVAEAQAKEYGHSVRRETCYLFAHGLLHLSGYDHIEESDKKVMREKEELVLSGLGITRED